MGFDIEVGVVQDTGTGIRTGTLLRWVCGNGAGWRAVGERARLQHTAHHTSTRATPATGARTTAHSTYWLARLQNNAFKQCVLRLWMGASERTQNSARHCTLHGIWLARKRAPQIPTPETPPTGFEELAPRWPERRVLVRERAQQRHGALCLALARGADGHVDGTCAGIIGDTGADGVAGGDVDDRAALGDAGGGGLGWR